MKKTTLQNISNGLCLAVCESAYETKEKRIINLFLSSALFIGLIGAFHSMLELNCLPLALVVGLTAIAAIVAANVVADVVAPTNKLTLITANALICALISAFICVAVYIMTAISPKIWPDVITNGFPLLFNQLFAVSEAHQAYSYNMFNIGVPLDSHGRYMTAAFLLSTVLLAALSALTASARNKTFAVLLIALIIFTQIYFGVFPTSGWNIFLCLIAMFILACKDRFTLSVAPHSGILLLVALSLIFAVIYGSFPNPDPALSELSEHIRDQFDRQVEQPSAQAERQFSGPRQSERENISLNAAKVSDDPYRQAGLNEFSVDYEERFQGAEIGEADPGIPPIMYLLGIIMLMLLYAAMRFAFNSRKAAKRRANFALSDCAAAINHMFLYIIEWLKAYGLNEDNTVYSAYAESVSLLISPECAKRYSVTVSLWQESVYSDHFMSPEQREQVRVFLDEIKAVVWKNSSLISKIRIKFKGY